MLKIIVSNESDKYSTGMDICPSCDSDNIANEDAEEDLGNGETRLEITCHDCTYQWLEVYKANRCIEIYGRDDE
ncbi:MAG: hypothetical protein EOP04_31610 [Proteobacteria bacterium]|nr:MAG: hypothetical protein EOP04_31610 [Pseudomonadota bacterium]